MKFRDIISKFERNDEGVYIGELTHKEICMLRLALKTQDAIEDTLDEEIELRKKDRIPEIGKLLKQIRKNRSELIGDMSSKLGITTSLLSSIETGETRIPKDLPNRIKERYALDYLELDKLNNILKKKI